MFFDRLIERIDLHQILRDQIFLTLIDCMIKEISVGQSSRLTILIWASHIKTG
jgi:hypothetical protein